VRFEGWRIDGRDENVTTYTVGERGNGADRAWGVPRDGAAYENDRARDDAEASGPSLQRAVGDPSSMNGIETLALAAYSFFALAALTVLAAALVHYLT
jgi:hypothetical protein